MNGMMTSYQQTLTSFEDRAKILLRPLLGFIATLWLLEIIDWLFFGGSMDYLGILPRQYVGLRGILLAPLLHSGFGHLLANTLPILVLGFMLRLRHQAHAVFITAIILVVSGVGTWLVGPPNTVTIGASGLVFGYFAFLVVNAWYERSKGAIAFALVVIIAYGGIIWGIFPAGNGVSWQSHFFGLVGGVIAAYYLHRRFDQ